MQYFDKNGKEIKAGMKILNHDFHHGHRMIEFCISCAVAYIL